MKFEMKSIKKATPLIAGTVAGLSLLIFTNTEIAQAQVDTAIGNDVSSNELRAITIESWDIDYSTQGYGWQVLTNEEGRATGEYEFKASGLKYEREVKLMPGTPRDIRYNQDFDAPYVLGVKYSFSFPGYNVVTIRPPRVDQYMIERARPHLNEIALAEIGNGEEVDINCYDDPTLSEYQDTNRPIYVDCVNGIDMPGTVHQISVWVMGRGNEYELEAWIEDWRGDTHILKFGSIDFIGWRPMVVDVPAYIPQDIGSFPQIKTLVFRQFKIRAKPETSLEPVYVFFDELRVLTDIFEVHFDGATLDFNTADCERKNRLFRLIRQNARYPDHWPALTNCQDAPGEANPANVTQPQ